MALWGGQLYCGQICLPASASNEVQEAHHQKNRGRYTTPTKPMQIMTNMSMMIILMMTWKN